MWLTPTILLRIHSRPILGWRLVVVELELNLIACPPLRFCLFSIVWSWVSHGKLCTCLETFEKFHLVGMLNFHFSCVAFIPNWHTHLRKAHCTLLWLSGFWNWSQIHICATGQIGNKFCIIVFIVISWLMFLLLYIYC